MRGPQPSPSAKDFLCTVHSPGAGPTRGLKNPGRLPRPHRIVPQALREAGMLWCESGGCPQEMLPRRPLPARRPEMKGRLYNFGQLWRGAAWAVWRGDPPTPTPPPPLPLVSLWLWSGLTLLEEFPPRAALFGPVWQEEGGPVPKGWPYVPPEGHFSQRWGLA